MNKLPIRVSKLMVTALAGLLAVGMLLVFDKLALAGIEEERDLAQIAYSLAPFQQGTDLDVAITKTVSAEFIRPGQTITYVLSFANHGPAEALTLTITDTMPISLTNVITIANPAPLVGTAVGNVYTWVYTNMAAASGGTITITAQVSSILDDGAGLVNTVEISNCEDYMLDNNRQVVTTTVNFYKVYLPLVSKNLRGDYEPNDSSSQAYGPLTSGQTYYSHLESAMDNDDYFYITLSSSATIVVDLTNIPAGCDYDLFLYDVNLNKLGESRNYGDTDEQIVYSTAQSGKYYIRIYRYSGYSATQAYALRATY